MVSLTRSRIVKYYILSKKQIPNPRTYPGGIFVIEKPTKVLLDNNHEDGFHMSTISGWPSLTPAEHLQGISIGSFIALDSTSKLIVLQKQRDYLIDAAAQIARNKVAQKMGRTEVEELTAYIDRNKEMRLKMSKEESNYALITANIQNAKRELSYEMENFPKLEKHLMEWEHEYQVRFEHYLEMQKEKYKEDLMEEARIQAKKFSDAHNHTQTERNETLQTSYESVESSFNRNWEFEQTIRKDEWEVYIDRIFGFTDHVSGWSSLTSVIKSNSISIDEFKLLNEANQQHLLSRQRDYVIEAAAHLVRNQYARTSNARNKARLNLYIVRNRELLLNISSQDANFSSIAANIKNAEKEVTEIINSASDLHDHFSDWNVELRRRVEHCQRMNGEYQKSSYSGTPVKPDLESRADWAEYLHNIFYTIDFFETLDVSRPSES